MRTTKPGIEDVSPAVLLKGSGPSRKALPSRLPSRLRVNRASGVNEWRVAGQEEEGFLASLEMTVGEAGIKADPSPPFANDATGFGMTTRGEEAEASFGVEKAASSRRSPKNAGSTGRVLHSCEA